MVGVSGIRGRVGAGLTPDVVAQYAAAFGAWSLRAVGLAGHRRRARQPRVGSDVPSGRAAALQSVGCDVLDIGMAPTPTVQLAVEHHHAAGGLAITASHNPIEWNALKFIGPSGLFLDAAEGTEMRAWLERAIPRATWDRLGEVDVDDGAIERHIDAILALAYIDVEGIRARQFNVALDTCHGAGGTILPAAARAARLQRARRSIWSRMAAFTARPSRWPRIWGSWRRWCGRAGAVVGFAMDPDVDRLALVSRRGVGDRRGLHACARRTCGSATATWSGGDEFVDQRIVDDIAARGGQSR